MPILPDFVITAKDADLKFEADLFVGEYLLRRYESFPQDKIIEIQYETGESLTIAQLRVQAKSIASYLIRHGVKLGDMVAIYMGNVLPYTSIALGVVLSGATFTFVREDFINNIEFRELIGEPKFVFVEGKERLQKLEAASYSGLIVIDEGSKEWLSFQDCLNDDGTFYSDTTKLKGNPSDCVALISFTGGTTGLPKPVMITHKAIVACMTIDAVHGLSYGKDAKNIIQIGRFPTNHISSFVFRVLSTQFCPTTVVIRSDENPATNLLEIIDRFNVTHFLTDSRNLINWCRIPGVTSMYKLQSVLRILVCGGILVERMLQNVKQLFPNAAILNRFASSECCGILTIPTAVPASVGRLVCNSQAKVVDFKSKETLPSYSIGELCFKGPQRFLGYYKMSEKTAEAIDQDDFYHSGDLVYYDDDENFYFINRDTEVICHKSGLVSSSTLEAEILAGNNNVKEVSVISIPDSKNSKFQVARAIVIPVEWPKNVEIFKKEIEDSLKTEHSKIGIEGGIEVTKDVPRTVLGKPLKRAMVAHCAK